ncbi:hypothetical protein [Sulfuricurvum sp.]|nr:hypothetical protein [Sulfuricurvum sp.]MDD3596505.1 hypothetical protein [Sulfuricurvum sp.]
MESMIISTMSAIWIMAKMYETHSPKTFLESLKTIAIDIVQ